MLLSNVTDSPYRHHLNTALLKLSESGIITELKKKWWQQKRGGGKCQVNDKSIIKFLYYTIRIAHIMLSLFACYAFLCRKMVELVAQQNSVWRMWVASSLYYPLEWFYRVYTPFSSYFGMLPKSLFEKM